MNEIQTVLPIYQKSIDWDAFFAEYPVPDVFERTVYKWPREKYARFKTSVSCTWSGSAGKMNFIVAAGARRG